MADHRRTLIKNRIVTLYKEYVDIGDRVFASRPDPLFLTELPTLLVYFEGEEIDDQVTEPRYNNRVMTVHSDVIVYEMPIDQVERFLDERAFEMEAAWTANRYLAPAPHAELGKWLRETKLVGCTPVNVDGGGDRIFKSLRLINTVEYETEAFIHDPTAENDALTEFLRFKANYETTDGAEAEDQVTIREE